MKLVGARGYSDFDTVDQHVRIVGKAICGVVVDSKGNF
jgi:hypothetical protein